MHKFLTIDPKELTPIVGSVWDHILIHKRNMSEPKRYKLKKWYPCLNESWKEGDIVEKDGSYYYRRPGSESQLINAVYKGQVENNPEFWEEVEKKDYEILKVQTTPNHPQHFKGTVPSHIFDFDKGYIEKTFLLHPSWWNIYSVKRLSDGKVFTLGDKTNKGIIKIFKDYETCIHVRARGENSHDYFSGDIKELKHVKEPLFTTEDGVDIYEGDIYWIVRTDPNIAGKLWTVSKHSADIRSGGIQGYVYFFTKEDAEYFVDHFKPRYSKNDIKDAFKKVQTSARNQEHLIPEWIGNIKCEIFKILDNER